MDCTNYVKKTKVLISCSVTMELICALVFAYAKIRFPQDAAQILGLIQFYQFLFPMTEIALQHVSMVLRSEKQWDVVEALPDIGKLLVSFEPHHETTGFLAHLSRRLIGELIGFLWSGVRPSYVVVVVVHNFKDLLL